MKSFDWAAVGVMLAILAFLINNFQSKTVSALSTRISVLEDRWEIFTRMLQKDMGEILHSPHRPELDKLIEINDERKLTLEEAKELVRILDDTLCDRDLRPGHEVGIKLFKASLVSEYRLREVAEC